MSEDVAPASESGLFLVVYETEGGIYGVRYAIPVADFSGSPLIGTAPLAVTFSNSPLPLTYTTAYTLRAERPQEASRLPANQRSHAPSGAWLFSG